MEQQTKMMMNKKTKMSSSLLLLSSSNYLFNLLHEDLIIDEILLKLPVSSLLRLRSVSRYFHCLITSPSFIKKHLHHTSAQPNHNLVLISSQTNWYDCKKQYVFLHYECSFSTTTTTGDDDDDLQVKVKKMDCPFDQYTQIQASCNGLLFLHKFYAGAGKFYDGAGMKMERGYIWNPCTKEYKEVLPPSRVQEHLFEGIQLLRWLYVGNPPSGVSGFGGFGYDCTTDEYKILYYEFRVGHLPHDPADTLVSIIEFKVYNLGTNTWTRISSHNNPCRRLFMGQLWKSIGFFTNGALHWIMSSSSIIPPVRVKPSKEWFRTFGKDTNKLLRTCTNDAKIISFCMEKEEFREIQKPYHHYSTATTTEVVDYAYGELQELQGCLCLCECPLLGFDKVVDIWMLKDYANESSWTKLYTVMITKDWDWIFSSYIELMSLRLLRLFKNDEIVMIKDRFKDIVVYDPVKHISRPVENHLDKGIRKDWNNEMIYVKSLVSLNSGTYASKLVS